MISEKLMPIAWVEFLHVKRWEKRNKTVFYWGVIKMPSMFK